MQPSDDKPSLRSAMVSGAAWMIAMRWIVRGIGLVSTVILVRLLAPEDFGLIAMAYLVVSLLEVLTSFGVDLALIQSSEASKEHFDTAWTIKLIQSASVALILAAISPLAAVYFEEPRVKPLMWFLCVGDFALGFTNIFRFACACSTKFIFRNSLHLACYKRYSLLHFVNLSLSIF